MRNLDNVFVDMGVLRRKKKRIKKSVKCIGCGATIYIGLSAKENIRRKICPMCMRYKKKKKIPIAGTHGNYIGKFKGTGHMWHRIPAKSSLEAKAKMLKGTRYTYDEVTIKRYMKKMRR